MLSPLLTLPGATAIADSHVQTSVTFDPSEDEFPEGIAVGKTGDGHVRLTLRDEIRRVDPSGDQAVMASFDHGAGPAGLAVDARGDVYTAAFAVRCRNRAERPRAEGCLPRRA